MSEGESVLVRAKRSLHESFRLFDTDKSGYIEFHELIILMKKLADSFHVEHPLDGEVAEIFAELDLNGDGKISQSEFEPLVEEVAKIIEQ